MKLSYVLIGRWGTIINHSHGQFKMDELQINPSEINLISKGKIQIEDDAWITDKVTICSNVYIERGVVIASDSVVTEGVLPYSMVGGRPAKIIKYEK